MSINLFPVNTDRAGNTGGIFGDKVAAVALRLIYGVNFTFRRCCDLDREFICAVGKASGKIVPEARCDLDAEAFSVDENFNTFHGIRNFEGIRMVPISGKLGFVADKA